MHLREVPKIQKMGKAQPPQLQKLRCALIFYFETLQTNVSKICCGLIALHLIY